MIEQDRIRVVIVEDDRIAREGLRMLVDGTPGYRCNAVFGSVEQALAGRGGEPPDVVLLDIKLPGIPGSQGVGSLRERWPKAAVLMLTAFTDEDKVFESLCNGAVGYLLKSTPPARLLEAVREAHRGGRAHVARDRAQSGEAPAQHTAGRPGRRAHTAGSPSAPSAGRGLRL